MFSCVNFKSTLLLCKNIPSKTVALNGGTFAPQVTLEGVWNWGHNAAGIQRGEVGGAAEHPTRHGMAPTSTRLSALRLRNLGVRNGRGANRLQ